MSMLELLKTTIETKSTVMDGNILKTDRFLNQSVDPVLMKEIGLAFFEHFRDEHPQKIITIESSGIAPAMAAAFEFNVPLVFLKKSRPLSMRNPLIATVHSYTKNIDTLLYLEEGLIEPGERVLFIDDFLANGQAYTAVKQLVNDAGAELCGVGIVIEKAWQKGHQILMDHNENLCALASIASMSEDGIVFCEE